MSAPPDLYRWVEDKRESFIAKDATISKKKLKQALLRSYNKQFEEKSGLPAQINNVIKTLEAKKPEIQRPRFANDSLANNSRSSTSKAMVTATEEHHCSKEKIVVQQLSNSEYFNVNAKIQSLQEHLEDMKLEVDEDSTRHYKTEDSERLLLGEYDAVPKTNIVDTILFCPLAAMDDDRQRWPQHGLIGAVQAAGGSREGVEKNARLYLNTELPASIFICGVQGSGKSHTLTCILENWLLPSTLHGRQTQPCSAMVFHYDINASHDAPRPTEAAFMSHAARDFPGHSPVTCVTVFAPPSNYLRLRREYGSIPGIIVHPFLLKPSKLTISTMLTLMAVQTTSNQPLYISTVRALLRVMATESDGAFDYNDFMLRLKKVNLTPDQRYSLDQRLNLLDSFVGHDENIPEFDTQPGALTIVDLSCPFIDHDMACALFDIALSSYLDSPQGNGKVIALDEAHTYMADSPGARALTESILYAIRLQRHKGLRIVVSTQEPSMSSQILDLCTAVVVHRFTSPAWYKKLEEHIGVCINANRSVPAFEQILRLKTGEALIYCPSADIETADEQGLFLKISEEMFKVRIRRKITWDAGYSMRSAGD
ncbi:MAG: hypothetical protein M1828_002161 [Chrysothrix sp. TS-e1954]|nr:MAG: hypothetical protein M1828_002161 [Chrysothrix sp. TS-e1954]